MTLNASDFVIQVVEVFERLQIPYITVGSFSSNVYGIPRSTKDVDFVIELGNTPINKVAAELKSEFTLEPQMAFETINRNDALSNAASAHALHR